MLQIQNDTSFHTILNQVDQRARKPTPIGKLSCPVTSLRADETQPGKRGDIIRNTINQFKKNRGRCV